MPKKVEKYYPSLIMLSSSEKITVAELLRAGRSVSEIARRTGRSLATIYKYKKIADENPLMIVEKGDRIPSKLIPFQALIEKKVRSGVRNSTVLFQELKNEGYSGSYGLVNAYAQQIAFPKEEGYRRSVYVETGPGEQAQVDWGSFGKIEIGGRVQRLYAFVYVLSYSRTVYVEFVVRQNQPTFQSCHMHAFEKLGIPRKIRYDNIKTVVFNREKMPDGTRRPNFNPRFIDFARYYGFEPDLCPPYWPRAKGKVEISVKYLRYNFMINQVFGKTYRTLEELNQHVTQWIEEIAHQRIHRTTGEKPSDRWQKEKESLKFPTHIPAYNTFPLITRRSTQNGMVQFKRNLYSVPQEFAQKKLDVQEISNRGIPHIHIYYQDRLIRTYEVSSERGIWISHDDDIPQKKRGRGRPRKVDKKSDIVIPARDLSYYNL